MGLNVEIDYDIVDRIIIKCLTEHANVFLEDSNDPHEAIANKAKEFAAFCTVLEYFMTEDEYEGFIETTKGKRVE